MTEKTYTVVKINEYTSVVIDDSNGYINGSLISRRCRGLAFSTFLNLKGMEAKLKELEKIFGVPTVTVGGKNTGRTYWVHPYLAVSLFEMCKPPFKDLLTNWAKGLGWDIIETFEKVEKSREISSEKEIPENYFSIKEYLSLHNVHLPSGTVSQALGVAVREEILGAFGSKEIILKKCNHYDKKDLDRIFYTAPEPKALARLGHVLKAA